MLDCKIPPVVVLIVSAGIVVGIPYIFPFMESDLLGCVYFLL